MIIAPACAPGAHPNLLNPAGTSGIYIIPAAWRVPPGPERDQLDGAMHRHHWSCRWCQQAPGSSRVAADWRAYVHGCGWAAYLAGAYVRTASRGEPAAEGGWVL